MRDKCWLCVRVGSNVYLRVLAILMLCGINALLAQADRDSGLVGFLIGVIGRCRFGRSVRV